MNELTAFGTRFTDLDTAGALAAIEARPPGAPFAYVATPNAVHVVHYERGEALMVAGLDAAWMRLNDSRVVARAAKLATGLHLPLAPGSDLTVALLPRIPPGEAVTIIGGTAAMEERLRARYDWRLFRHDPPMGFIQDEAEVAACIAFVLAHPARYVFLACGAPQSEMLGRRILEAGGAVGTGLCIGASLLFATGIEARAPRFMQRAGIEWLHRLLREPRRMSRRLLHSQLPLLGLAWRYRRR